MKKREDMKEYAKIYGRMLVLSIVVSAMMILIFSWIVFKVEAAQQYIKAFIAATYIFTSAGAGAYTGHKIKRKRIWFGCLAGIFYFLLLFVVSFFTGSFHCESIFSSFSVCVICVVSAILGAIFIP